MKAQFCFAIPILVSLFQHYIFLEPFWRLVLISGPGCRFLFEITFFYVSENHFSPVPNHSYAIHFPANWLHKSSTMVKNCSFFPHLFEYFGLAINITELQCTLDIFNHFYFWKTSRRDVTISYKLQHQKHCFRKTSNNCTQKNDFLLIHFPFKTCVVLAWFQNCLRPLYGVFLSFQKRRQQAHVSTSVLYCEQKQSITYVPLLFCDCWLKKYELNITNFAAKTSTKQYFLRKYSHSFG